MNDLHGDALSRICGDMDDLESKRMFPPKAEGGATITISIEPGTSGEVSDEESADDEMSDGGEVPMAPIGNDDDDIALPPFLRKKKAK